MARFSTCWFAVLPLLAAGPLVALAAGRADELAAARKLLLTGKYAEAEDAYRFKVMPKTTAFEEWLEYTFSDMEVDTKGNNSADINLIWGKLKLPFTVETAIK